MGGPPRHCCCSSFVLVQAHVYMCIYIYFKYTDGTGLRTDGWSFVKQKILECMMNGVLVEQKFLECMMNRSLVYLVICVRF
jgi:hypothetical protein